MDENQNRRSFLKKYGVLLFGGMLYPALPACSVARYGRIEVTRFHMNMLVMLIAYVHNREEGLQTLKEAFNQILRYERIFSAFDRNSELNRVCRNAVHIPTKVSPELFEVLSAAQSLARQSKGFFDPTIGPVLELWRNARQTGMMPDPPIIEARLDLCGYEKMVLDPGDKTVRMLQKNMHMDLGAIAKGYIGDQIIRYLHSQGISSAAYHAGGDIVTGNAPPGEEGWIINLPRQPKTWIISDEALSISGDMYQHLEVAGIRYNHVIDPLTGKAMTGNISSVCRAPSGMMADANATLKSVRDSNS